MTASREHGERLIVHTPPGHDAARRYVLDLVLGEWLGQSFDVLPSDGLAVTIRHSDDLDGKQVEIPDILFATSAEDWLTERSIAPTPVARLVVDPHSSDPTGDANLLPAIFADPSSDGRASHSLETGVRLGVDVFGSVFYLVSCYEEVVGGPRDQDGRFPAEASLAAREGFLQRPIVDEYVDLLWTGIHSLWPTLERLASSFRLRMTHDVDQPWAVRGKPILAVARSVGKDIIGRRDPRLAFARGRAFIDDRLGRDIRDPFDTFELLMDATERCGLRCTFYFLAGNQPGDHDFRYRIDDPQILAHLRRIGARGHEIGLHASYMSHGSVERIHMELGALRAACEMVGVEQADWGVRHHYLRFDASRSWRDYLAAGLTHDSTLGFAELVGFRAGTCREYPVFDLVDDCPLRLRERPLTVMDVTMYEYMGLGGHAADERLMELVETCRSHQGDAVVLYHNNSLPLFGITDRYASLVSSLAHRQGDA